MRQLQHFINAVIIDLADTFQPDLHYLLEIAASLGHAVYIFVVIQLLEHIGTIPRVLYYRKSHVRLQGKQLTVAVGKGYYAVGNKKVLIVCIEVVFLEFIHLIM